MTSYVYFIRPVGMDGPVKIGCSWDPEGRLATLGTWSPLPLEIALKIEGDFNTEKHLHNHFAADHSHHEWFRASAELLRVMASLKAGAPLSGLVDTTVEASLLRRARYAGRAQKPEWHRLRKQLQASAVVRSRQAPRPGCHPLRPRRLLRDPRRMVRRAASHGR